MVCYTIKKEEECLPNRNLLPTIWSTLPIGSVEEALAIAAAFFVFSSCLRDGNVLQIVQTDSQTERVGWIDTHTLIEKGDQKIAA